MLIAVIPTEIRRLGRTDIHDGTDRNWSLILEAIGMQCVSLPLEGRIAELLNRVNPQGILLTGGGTVAISNAALSPRDRAERAASEWAVGHGIPILGICRGFQFLHIRSGGDLSTVPGHIATRHSVTTQNGVREVNSFHGLAISAVAPRVRALATAMDGSVEAAVADDGSWMGLMWHPERADPFDGEDLHIISNFYRKMR